ncbi:MAG: hypothetical protein JO122_18575 [Acetobacteraceae bacterium]|nr:hypothetical protein [Acetobacteraceae bacterium]
MTPTESRYHDTLDSIRAIYDRLPDGIDPDFDTGLDELAYEFAVLRMAPDRN